MKEDFQYVKKLNKARYKQDVKSQGQQYLYINVFLISLQSEHVLYF